jgi:hypothetical protein
MHIHGNRMNVNLDLNAAYAAQQAQARREAEATRKKLFESAMRVAAENEYCVVSLAGQQENSEGQPDQERERSKGQKKGSGQDASSHISDWA